MRYMSEKKPKERQRRHRYQRREDPKPMVLTKRDMEIVEAVYLYRVLSQKQIEKLFFGHRAAAQRRLEALFDHAYLDRIPLPVNGALLNSPTLYLLNQRGAALLTSKMGYSDVRWKRDYQKVSTDFLLHALAINDFRINVVLACQNLNYPLLTWVGESRLKGDYDRVKLPGLVKPVSVIPDSHFVIDTPRQAAKTRAYFFVELDRGTETLQRIQTKVRAYNAYVDEGGYEKRYGVKGLRVLFVALSRKRMMNMKKAAEAVGGRNRFWFASLDELTPENVLSQPIWLSAGKDEPLQLIEV